MDKIVKFDPITQRDVSLACWNGRHDFDGIPLDDDYEPQCSVDECMCLCHKRNQRRVAVDLFKERLRNARK